MPGFGPDRLGAGIPPIPGTGALAFGSGLGIEPAFEDALFIIELVAGAEFIILLWSIAGGGTGLGNLIELVAVTGAEFIILFCSIWEGGTGLGNLIESVAGVGATIVFWPIDSAGDGSAGAGAEGVILLWPIDRVGAGLCDVFPFKEVARAGFPDKNFFTSWS